MMKKSVSIDPKENGAYYTPDDIVRTLLSWAIHNEQDRLLDPSCGDGRFLAGSRNAVGIEQDLEATTIAMARAPGALVHEGDFFAWAANTLERFECAAGNPPFIRYQTFKGEVRERALSLCARLGAKFSGLTSSWAPFLVATASLLKSGGRMAFVVPAEIGHAPYAAPLMEYLVDRFEKVHVIAIRRKLFPELSEDCWLLYAEGAGGKTDQISLSVVSEFVFSSVPPSVTESVSVAEWRDVWNRRLRPYLLSTDIRELYLSTVAEKKTRRFGWFASIGIGYVTGANSFFHLRPSEARRLGIPDTFLKPSVRNGRVLTSRRITDDTVNGWRLNDDPILLLNIPKDAKLPHAVHRYLDTDGGQAARQAYKCRSRAPWYSVPDVQVPDFFLSYMSGRQPGLVANDAACTCTNSVHSVRLKRRVSRERLLETWQHPFVQLSCELEGHPLGGGMLKLEPREATRVAIPGKDHLKTIKSEMCFQALATMREWRHYETT